MFDLVCLAIEAANPTAIENVGSIQLRHSNTPDTGTHRSPTAITRTKISASQNDGIDTNISEAKIAALSFHVY
jgi:hypothetical protein